MPHNELRLYANIERTIQLQLPSLQTTSSRTGYLSQFELLVIRYELNVHLSIK